MNQIYHAIKEFLADRFSLHEDSAHEIEIIDSIRKNIEFKGSNLWALIFAIFMASIGLNVNSTAVIIGAMLISPLMGPIMGVGLGIGINDVELIRKALKNLLIAASISIAVSAFYFFITPLHEAQSELLARTTPTIWDVFIAFFGGLAGIVGGSRREKNNVIPGVAIATALMPPLCTAGFGLAIGNWYYFLGAMYLFFINSVFICISTFIIVRYMKLPRTAFEDKEREKRVVKGIITVVILTMLPSIYLAYRIVHKSIFESNANAFLKSEFVFPRAHIINKEFRYERDSNEINLLLIGEDLSPGTIDTLKKKLPLYKLSDTRLVISQGLNAKQQIDFSQIKASIIEEMAVREEKQKKNHPNPDKTNIIEFGYSPDIRAELKALYPTLTSYNLTKSVTNIIDTNLLDTVVLFVGNFSKPIKNEEKKKLSSWLKMRIRTDTVVMVTQVNHKK